MTALEKMLEAMNANVEPAAGTYRDALIELDRVIEEHDAGLRAALILRGKIETFAEVSSVFREIRRKANSHPADPVPGIPGGTTMCSICGTREARVWDESTPYCKRCARDEGVVIKGKV